MQKNISMKSLWLPEGNQQAKPSGFQRFRLEETCHHEGAHATAAHQLGVPLQSVSVVEGGDSLGHTQLKNRLDGLDTNKKSPAEIEDFVRKQGIICLSGAAGSLLFSGMPNWSGASADLEALDSLLLLVTSSQLDRDIRKKRLWDQAKTLIYGNASLVHALADALFQHRTLNSEQVRQVFDEAKAKTKGGNGR